MTAKLSLSCNVGNLWRVRKKLKTKMRRQMEGCRFQSTERTNFRSDSTKCFLSRNKKPSRGPRQCNRKTTAAIMRNRLRKSDRACPYSQARWTIFVTPRWPRQSSTAVTSKCYRTRRPISWWWRRREVGSSPIGMIRVRRKIRIWI